MKLGYLLFGILALFAAVSYAEEDNAVVVLTDDNFADVTSDGTWFVKFYAPWCGHCKKLAPTWEEIAEKLNNGDGTKIAKIDCTEAGKETCSKHGVRGFPTLKLVSGDKSVKYEGARDAKSLEKFAGQSVEEAVAAQKEAEAREAEAARAAEEEAVKNNENADVKILTEGIFDKMTSEGSWFIKFYAPWCGHCKRLAPTWEELGQATNDVDGLNVAKIDCTIHKKICSREGVRGYPTLKFMKNGGSAEKYAGGRTLEELKSYALEQHNAGSGHDEL